MDPALPPDLVALLRDLQRRVGQLERYTGNPLDLAGAGSPEGVVAAPVGATYRRLNGSTGTSLYIKEAGDGSTGWQPV